MSGATVSFHVGTSTSLAHNNRENLYGNPDIDSTRTHENIYYTKEDIKQIYSENFDEAVKEYNDRQKRSDRKIDDYYKKILHDKKTEPQREIIVAIGKADDEIPCNYKKYILDHYMKGFQDRNPNLKVYNAVMHLDEANPHLHINYVPIYAASRGLKKRVGQNKAIEQQGFKDFEEWRGAETGVLEESMSKLTIKREFKGSHDYMRVSEYKEYAEALNELKMDVKSLEGIKDTIIPLKAEFEAKKAFIRECDSESDISVGLPEYAKVKKNLMGQETVTVPIEKWKAKHVSANEKSYLQKAYSEFDHYVKKFEKRVEDFNKTSSAQQIKVLEHKVKSLELKNDELFSENKKLKKDLSFFEKFLEKFNLHEKFKAFKFSLQPKRIIGTKNHDRER